MGFETILLNLSVIVANVVLVVDLTTIKPSEPR